MEALKVLEKKIAALVELVQQFKAENSKLADENAKLSKKIEALESSKASEVERFEKLDKEKALTKSAISSLIKSIDTLVVPENR